MLNKNTVILPNPEKLLGFNNNILTEDLSSVYNQKNNQLTTLDIDNYLQSQPIDTKSEGIGYLFGKKLQYLDHGKSLKTDVIGPLIDPLTGIDETQPVASEITPTETTWEPLYEPGVGGWLTSFKISPHDSDIIIAGGDMLGVAYSHDGGKSWLGGQGLKSWEIEEITFDPNDPNKIWLATKSGPYLSLDQGQTWIEKRNGLPDFQWGTFVAPIQEILINPNNSNHLLAFTGHQRGDEASETSLGEVYQSLDNGESWQFISQIGTQIDNNIYDVDFSANNFNQLFASTDEGLFRSIDGGKTWTASGSNLPLGHQKSLATHSSDPNTLLITVNGQGVYRSTDAGETFEAVNNGLNISDMTQSFFDQIRFAPNNPNIAFFGERKTGGNYLSQDGGLTWNKVDGYEQGSYSMENKYFRAFDIDPNNHQRMIGGTGEGIWLTEDLGNSWQDTSSTEISENHWRGNGYSGLVVVNFHWDQFHTNQSFIAAMDSGKWMSRDDLNTWEWAGGHRGNGMSDFAGLIDVSFTNAPTDQQVIYGVVGQSGIQSSRGVYVSFDGGNNWQRQSIPFAEGRGRKIVAHPTETNKSWLVWDDKLFFSNDYGQTWTQQLTTAGNIYELTPDYASETFQVYVGSQSGLWQSSDVNGNNYNLVPGSDVDAWGITRIDIVDHDTLYAVNAKRDGYSQRGIWQYDQGVWTQLTNNKSDGSTPFRWVADIAVDPRNPDRILAATDQDPFLSVSQATGVWLSEDGGNSWQPFNDGLSMLRVKNIQFKPDDSGTVVIGTTGGGLYRTQIGGDTTAPMAHVELDNLIQPGAENYSFQVTYTDDTAIDLNSLDNNDWIVTGDNGFTANATLSDVTSLINGTTVVATYSINAPAGTWDAEDNGTYTLSLVSQEVKDVHDNAALGGMLETFTVDMNALFEQGNDGQGLVTIEAEEFHQRTSPDGVHQWVLVNDSSASGGESLQALVDDGTNYNTGYEINSPRLDYHINFTETGTHYVWILGKAGGSNIDLSDSIHAGLNGQPVNTADRISGFTGDYGWSNGTMDSVRATLEVTEAGVQTFNLWMREDGFIVDQIVLTTDETFDPTQPQTEPRFQQSNDAQGLVTIEAEQFHNTTSPDGVHQWVIMDDSSASEGQSVQALVDDNTNYNTDYESFSPRLDYEINFTQTGTHYIWVLGKGGGSRVNNSDSVHAGLDGQGESTAERISKFTENYGWSNRTMENTRATIQVTSTGVHTLNLWMREDGFVLDQIILTSSWREIPD
ncbi:MAG: hypothetical protein QNJ42_22375 [Crocosphaera sp.]|nr:hypothetical protein [Crocosphaera sp.]